MASKKDFKSVAAMNFITGDQSATAESVEEEKKVEEAAPKVPGQIQSNIPVPPAGYKVVFFERKSKRIQLVVRPSIYEKATNAAKASGLSLNEYIAQLIENA